MIRKQIYLTDEMNRKLNEIANARNIPQAELIREGLETYLTQQESKDETWDDLLRQMRNSEIKPLQWRRENLYMERFGKGGTLDERKQSAD